MLEVVEHTLAVQEVNSRTQEIPAKSLSEAQTSVAARHVDNIYHLFERHDLDCSEEHDDIDMAGE